MIKFALYQHLRNVWFTRDVLPLRNADIKAVLCLVLPSIVAFCQASRRRTLLDTAVAISHALTRWYALTRYVVDHGPLKIDNNVVERSLYTRV